MFLVFSIIHFRESNQILKDIIYNDESLCLQRGGIERKNLDGFFSVPNKNPESAIKKRIPDSDSKIGRIPDCGFRIRIANPNYNRY